MGTNYGQGGVVCSVQRVVGGGSVQCAVCNVLLAVCGVRCTVYSVQYALCSVMCEVCSVK